MRRDMQEKLLDSHKLLVVLFGWVLVWVFWGGRGEIGLVFCGGGVGLGFFEGFLLFFNEEKHCQSKLQNWKQP